MDDVIVIGAGYAGLLTANRLAPHARVRVVDPRDAMVDRIRLHELAAGTRPAQRTARPLHHALDRRVARTRARVAALEPGLVRLEGGGELRASHIVLAHGRGAARPGSIDTFEDALALRARLAAAAPGSSVEIVGAGLTGLELASEVAAAHPALHLRLVARQPVGHDLAPGAAAHLCRVLDRLGVEVTTEPAGADLVVDQTGPRPEPMGASSGFALDASGRIRTDRCLRVLGPDGAPLQGVWGAGDAIAVDGLPWLRGGCASAEPLGASAADRVRSTIEGREPMPIDIGFAFRCISLGRRDAVVQFVTPDDRPRAAWLGGRRAAAWKESISRIALRVPLSWSRAYRPFRGPTEEGAMARGTTTAVSR